jgi:hypothetical protein
MTMSDLNINWGEVIKKEALGIGDYDLGEIIGVEAGHVITKKGTVDKDKFSLEIIEMIVCHFIMTV